MKLIPGKNKGDGTRWEGAPRLLGFVMIGLVVLAGVGAFAKSEIQSILTPGDTITASFSRQYRLQNYKSLVKVAQVNVGEVTGVNVEDNGTATVSMRIDNGVKEKLGGQPAAVIQPTLVVGGIYYIELIPAGRGQRFSGHIPVGRTSVPVELDRVLQPIDPNAQKGLQAFIRQTDAGLKVGDREALRDLVRSVPPTLGPASVVIDAARGTEPTRDLPRLVTGLENFATDFTKRDGQLASNINGLATLSATFGATRVPITQTFATLPQTLRTSRAGLIDLRPALDKLTETAPKFRRSARELDPLLRKLDPVLHRARPVLHDLREVLDDLRPLAKDLVPVVRKANGVLKDLQGAPLDRLRGPIIDTLNSDYHGKGVYAGSGNDHKLYEEINYFVAVTAQVWADKTRNGGVGVLSADLGGNSLTGGSQFPRTLEQYLESGGLARPRGPQDATPKGARPAPRPRPHANPDPVIAPNRSRGDQVAPGDVNPLLPGGLGGDK